MKNYIYVLIIFLFSCNEPLKVTVISDITSGPNTIIFDNKDTLITSNAVDSIFLSSSNRKHSFTVNNAKPVEFLLNDKGGILNIAKKEFVVEQIEYESETGEGSLFGHEINLNSYVLIDSFIVARKSYETIERVELKKIVDSIKVRKNGNYKSPIDSRFPSEVDEYDRSESVNGFKKIGNNELFIKQFWDYNFGDSIPAEIKVAVSKNNLQYENKVKKTFITFAEDFLLFAKKSRKRYTVIDVRDLLKDGEVSR